MSSTKAVEFSETMFRSGVKSWGTRETVHLNISVLHARVLGLTVTFGVMDYKLLTAYYGIQENA